MDLGLVFNTVAAFPAQFPSECNYHAENSYADLQRISFLQPGAESAFVISYRAFPVSVHLYQEPFDGWLDWLQQRNKYISNFNEQINGWTSRTVTRGSTTAGPAQAKRISVNADWTGDYRLTDKWSLEDDFSFENWRSPSMWATADTTLFGTPPTAPGQSGMLLPISVLTPATFATVCPAAPYNSPLCPQHNTSSGADVTNELVQQFLGQDIKRNPIELRYDFTRRLSVHVGYMYMSRNIADFSATFDTGEIYFPGGAAAP